MSRKEKTGNTHMRLMQGGVCMKDSDDESAQLVLLEVSSC